MLLKADRKCLSLAFSLARYYVGRAGSFLALSNLELNLLAFIERGIAGRLDFGMVDKQIFAAVIRDYESESLT